MLPKGWKRLRLGDLIARVDAGVSVNGEDRPATDGDVGVLKVSCVSSGTFLPEQNKTVLKDEVVRVKTSPKADRVIVSRSNTDALVGASAYVPQDYPNLFLSDKLWQLEPKDESAVCMRWLAYWLASDSVRAGLATRGTGTSGSMKNISKEALLEQWIHIPSMGEQKAMAVAIETWDSTIQVMEKRIANSQNQKEILTNDLMLGRVRWTKYRSASASMVAPQRSALKGWKKKKLGEIAVEISIKNSMNESLPVLSCTKHHGLVDSLSYFSKRVFSENTSTYKLVPRGSFAYATNHIDEGSIGYQDVYDNALISPMYTVFQANEQIHHGFLYKLLKTEHYRQIFAANTNASVDRRGSLRWGDFKKIEIPVPSFQEQAAIHEVLSVADREVAQLMTQLDYLKRERRVLMTDLLTGKRRLSVAETETSQELS